MAFPQVKASFGTLSPAAKIGLILIGLVILVMLVIGAINSFQKGAYEARATAAEVYRDALMAERKTLQLELARLKGEIAEQDAMIETLKQVAEAKRGDRDAAVQEVEAIEKEHAERKQIVNEALANTDNIDPAAYDKLRAAFCLDLCQRGYKLDCCLAK